VISDVLNLTDCDFSKTSSLLQCTDCQGNTTVKFHNKAMEQKLSMIKSDSVRQQVRQTLKAIAASGDNKSEPDFTMELKNPCKDLKYVPDDYYDGSCSVKTNVMCKDLFSKFLVVQISMKEVLMETKDAMKQTSDDCSLTEKTLNAEVAEENTLLLQHQAELAFAAQTVQRTQLLAGQKKSEHGRMEEVMTHNREECTTELKNLEAEKCQLEKIRSEMFLRLSTNKDKAMFIDCEVSDWVSSGCNASCDGGYENLTRNVLTEPAFGGVQCPILEAIQECNVHKCPVDCVENPWEGWSACSAGCDGGIKMRTRSIKTHAARGGTACDPITENVQCGTSACDTDCTLADWSKWSECSKKCDSGHRHRIKVELTPQSGAGTCPEPWDEERLVEEVCNTEACPTNDEVVATCNKTADIVFLIDGSGSLGADAFAEELVFARNFAKGFEHQNGQISVILFSGPYTWADYDECSAGAHDLTKDELKSKCGLEIVQHFKSATETQITLLDVPYPGGTTFTSGALKLAEAELLFARPEAEKIVILLTDGVPIDKKNTQDAATILRNKGIRLVAVPVEGLGINDKGTLMLKHLASKNMDDNTIIMEDWHLLANITQASTLVEDVCGESVQLPEICHEGLCRIWTDHPYSDPAWYPWENKCTWGECKGCTECLDTCQSWCNADTNEWKYKCNWQGCYSCDQCK